MALSSNDVRAKAVNLQRYWRRRDKKFKEWYGQIRMLDSLAQKDMESFVGNDPRASFNLISSILNQHIPHRLPPDSFGQEQMDAAGDLSKLFETVWKRVFDSYRLRGRDFMEDLISFLLSTGWYAVFATMTLDGTAAVAEVWNPATVYPMWDDVLTECAHIYTPGEAALRRLAARNGWKLDSISSNTTIYDYWWIEQTGLSLVVHNAIVIGTQLVKNDTIENRFSRIPIFIAPAGGLPDTGILSSGDTWTEEIGQSFIATNENVYKTSNKWWTFVLQILRDTAQARTFERTSNPQQLVKPETWYRRGAHYKLGPNDEVGFINPPPIPVELRSTQLDLEAMMQRGGPSWSMFGSFQQKMTSYAMSQVAATTNQVSRSYHKAIINCFTDIDNFWLGMMAEQNYKPYGIGLPAGLPEDTQLTAEYELRVPGDLVGRATTARMLNPNFELSDEFIMEGLFPEIKNPAEELGRVRASDARKNPIYAHISLIEALRQEAVLLRGAKDNDGAVLYEKAADRLEQQIVGEQQPAQSTQPTQQIRARPEVIPPQQNPKVLAENAEEGEQ